MALDLELKIASCSLESDIEEGEDSVEYINVLLVANKNKRFSSTDLKKPSIKSDCFDKL